MHQIGIIVQRVADGKRNDFALGTDQAAREAQLIKMADGRFHRAVFLADGHVLGAASLNAPGRVHAAHIVQIILRNRLVLPIGMVLQKPADVVALGREFLTFQRCQGLRIVHIICAVAEVLKREFTWVECFQLRLGIRQHGIERERNPSLRCIFLQHANNGFQRTLSGGEQVGGFFGIGSKEKIIIQAGDIITAGVAPYKGGCKVVFQRVFCAQIEQRIDPFPVFQRNLMKT